eukprot:7834851-Lingulodinium_polyedra.AAC.1
MHCVGRAAGCERSPCIRAAAHSLNIHCTIHCSLCAAHCALLNAHCSLRTARNATLIADCLLRIAR